MFLFNLLKKFAFDNGLDYEIVNDILTEYIFNGSISDDLIRRRLSDYHFGLLKITAITEAIKSFVEETYYKFRAEGE